jgi:hypothetical protein
MSPAKQQNHSPTRPNELVETPSILPDGEISGRDGQAGATGLRRGGCRAGRRGQRLGWRKRTGAFGGFIIGGAVPGEDVRAGGGAGDGRHGVVGRGTEQLRGVGPARLRGAAPPPPLQARQLLHLPPAAQHLRQQSNAHHITVHCY